tara:strand:- start:10567 stop:11868 length:1302 start_codon:yes stop_codon:yes gene_type:complete
MYHNIVIIGNKNYKNLELNKILDFFGNNIRFNFGIPCNNNGTIYDNIVLNNHVYEYSKKSLQEKIDKYCKLFSISETHIEKFHNNLNKFKNIEKQINDWKMINNFLEKISCPYKYTHLPRVGYLKMMQLIMNNIKPFIYGFSIYSIVEEHLYVKNLYYGNKEDDPIKRTGHNELNEIEILKWLHNNNYIDATLCLLEDEEICTLNCSILKPKSSSLCIILKCKGLLVLKNFYEEIIIEKFKSEVCNIFDNNKKIIQIDKKENCSEDERIFNIQDYSQFIKENFNNNSLLNNIAENYTKRHLNNKKTMANKLKYEKNKIKNSGAGWHRDNHDCQFKALLYLTDVNIDNGNFQFLTESSKEFIGFPDGRKDINNNFLHGNTRYTDETIKNILNNKRKILNICGDAGSLVLVDTTYIHRGNIIKSGERIALTQYFI